MTVYDPIDDLDFDSVDLVQQEGPVLFYGHKSGEYRYFSNFFPARFTLDGHTFACSEQAFMYEKSDDEAYKKRVLKTPSPHEVKKLGRSVKLRPGWDNFKYGWMVTVLKAKFSQNPPLARILLATGNRDIHEDCPDPWWGGGPNYPAGRDLLGKALIEVRAWLRASRSG